MPSRHLQAPFLPFLTSAAA